MKVLYNVSIVIIILLVIDIIFSVFIIKKTKGSGDITDEKNKQVKKHIKKTTKVVKKQIKNTTDVVQKGLENTTKIAINSIKSTNDNVKKIIKK